MPADMIELECPSCSEQLELDVGFAGGVCRCSGCGTLMTVPTRTGRGKAEVLTRPDRPDAPGGGVNRAEAPGRPETPGAAVPHRASDDLAAAAQQTFVTSTGRVVTVNVGAHIPTAAKRKRTAVRVVTVVVFCTVVLAVLAACVFAIIMLSKSATGGDGSNMADPTQQALHLFTFDPLANPLQLEHPNVLGLPMSSKTAIVFDMHGADTTSRDLAAKSLAGGLKHPAVRFNVVVVGTDADKPAMFNRGATSLSSLNTDQLAQFLAALAPKQNQLGPAITLALAENPERLIIVTANRLASGDMGPIEDAVATRPSLLIDAVALNRADALPLQDLVRSRDGTYIVLSTSRMQSWSE
jgi:hypothetical protein